MARVNVRDAERITVDKVDTAATWTRSYSVVPLSLKVSRRIPVPVPSIANSAVPVNVYRPAFTAVIREVFEVVECIPLLSRLSEAHSRAVTVRRSR